MGNFNNTNQFEPVTITTSTGLTNAVKIDAGGNHCVALSDDNKIYTWGANDEGQLGIGTVDPSKNVPQYISTMSGGTEIDVAAGVSFTIVLRADGSTRVAGSNDLRQLSICSPSASQFSPVFGFSFPGAGELQVPATMEHGWCINGTGELRTWGRNSYGATGTGLTGGSTCPPVHINYSGSGVCSMKPSDDNHPQPCCVAIQETGRTELATQTYGSSITYTGQDLSITGTLTVPTGVVLTFNSCDVVCTEDAKIYVETGGRLFIQSNTHLYACENMWHGIEAKNASWIYIRSGALVEDAITGLDIEYGSVYELNNATFNKNLTHFHKTMPSTGSPIYAGNYIIRNCEFLCQTTASVGTGTPVYTNLLPPHQTERTDIAIFAMGVPKIWVGNSSGNDNLIDNAEWGIYNYTVGNVQVWNNTIKNIGNGGNYNIFGPAAGGERIEVNNNEFYNTPFPILCYENDNTVRANIKDNLIDFAGMGTPPPTGMRGISVIEVTPAGGSTPSDYNHFNISKNTIRNATTGIYLENLRGNNNGTTATLWIYDNDITHACTPSDRGAGIRTENVTESYIGVNDITHPTGARNWQDIAIRSSLSNGNSIYCNNLHNMGNGLWFDGNQSTQTAVATNTFNRLHTAFLLNWGDIGPQPLVSTSDPHDNQWVDPSWWSLGLSRYTTDVLGTSSNNTEFRVQSAASSVYYPNVNNYPFGGDDVDVSVIGGAWPNTCQYFSGPSFKANGQESTAELAEAFQFILDTNEPQTEREASQQWIGRYGLYDKLQRNEELRTANAALESFYASSTESNMGNLHLALRAYRTAQQQANEASLGLEMLQQLSPVNRVEQTLKEVLVLLYTNALEEQPALNETETVNLRQIAQRCPLDDGFGVYIARAALVEVDSVPVDYSNPCENVKPSDERQGKMADASESSVYVYPNPTNGMLNLRYPISESQQATMEVYDLLGALVFTQTLNSTDSDATLVLSHLNTGLYSVRLLVDNQLEFVEKVSILTR